MTRRSFPIPLGASVQITDGHIEAQVSRTVPGFSRARVLYGIEGAGGTVTLLGPGGQWLAVTLTDGIHRGETVRLKPRAVRRLTYSDAELDTAREELNVLRSRLGDEPVDYATRQEPEREASGYRLHRACEGYVCRCEHPYEDCDE